MPDSFKVQCVTLIKVQTTKTFFFSQNLVSWQVNLYGQYKGLVRIEKSQSKLSSCKKNNCKIDRPCTVNSNS